MGGVFQLPRTQARVSLQRHGVKSVLVNCSRNGKGPCLSGSEARNRGQSFIAVSRGASSTQRQQKATSAASRFANRDSSRELGFSSYPRFLPLSRDVKRQQQRGPANEIAAETKRAGTGNHRRCKTSTTGRLSQSDSRASLFPRLGTTWRMVTSAVPAHR